MKDGDFVTIDYVARVKDTGEIFDLTDEALAKKESMYREDVNYGPVTFIVGANFVIRGLDEALHSMEVGEKKSIEISPDKAFGPRHEELVKLVPESQFKQQDMKPSPGAFVNVNNIRGRIVSVSGGRVKVDFNHPLAGKTLQYEIEVKGQITDRNEKVNSILDYFTGKSGKVKVGKVSDNEVEIETGVDVQRRLKELIATTISKWIGVKTVKFVDVFRHEELRQEEQKQEDGQAAESKAGGKAVKS